MAKLIGTAPNQVPLNQFLGTMAFQDSKGVTIQNGTANLSSLVVAVSSANNITANTITLNGGANAIVFANGTSNYITWNTNGLGAPTTGTRSSGTKISLYPVLSSTSVDYAIGVEGYAMWQSVGTANAAFRWYANTTSIATLNTTSFSTSANLVTNGGSLYISANGSTTSAPRGVFVTDSTSGEATRFALNDSDAVQAAYGSGLELTSYWGIVLYGNRAVGNFPTPGAFSSLNDLGVLIPAQRANNVVLQLRGSGATHSNSFLSIANSSGGVIHNFAANGNIGINNAAPTSALHVTGTGFISGNTTINTNTVFFDTVNDRVNIGLGTEAPQAVLSVGKQGPALADNSAFNRYHLHLFANTLGSVEGAGLAFTVFNTDSPASVPTATPGGAIVFERTGTFSQGKLHFKVKTTTGQSDALTKAITISETANVGIGTTSPNFKLQVNGSFAATTKSFVIDHPMHPGRILRYGSLEGPENGVYVRGKLEGTGVIELPDYWMYLVDEDTITVNLTAIGRPQHLYVDRIESNKVYVSCDNDEINCFYTVYAERKDVEKLVVEE